MATAATDPWTLVETVHGFNVDEVTSAFQKSIRRGLVENALLLAYEMTSTSPELEEHLWARLTVINCSSAMTCVRAVIDQCFAYIHCRGSLRTSGSITVRKFFP